MFDEIEKLFLEVLDKYYDAEDGVIDCRGNSSDYNDLEKEVEEYKTKFNQLIEETKLWF